ncbi:MAG: type II toxin-antitoxin system PemK/MazF family toxin [Chloroflexi bacterium]|nr:type II toxin-antitoxin system PemK/MazF family toxin [Chloroflexota bacterium]
MSGEVKRGDIYWVDWNPARDSEQSGMGRALVIQNDIGNKFSPTTIVACCSTATTKRYSFVVPIAARESGLPRDSTVNLSAILTISQSRLGSKCGSLGKSRMAEVDEAIKRSLALDKESG